jgi:hypothetical protein
MSLFLPYDAVPGSALFPDQYVFKTIAGVSKLRPRYIIPTPMCRQFRRNNANISELLDRRVSHVV